MVKVPDNTFLIIGAIFGAYMALNIGANDVAEIMLDLLLVQKH